jgi:hypothetical protein
LQLFPAAHAVFARKKDHGRAEASLIALYGMLARYERGNDVLESYRREQLDAVL